MTSTVRLILAVLWIVVLIPTAILAGLQIHSWFVRSELVAFEKQDQIELPTPYLDFLKRVDYPSRSELNKIYAASSKGIDPPTVETLDSLRKLCDSAEIFGLADTAVASVKLRNNGHKSAANVKVFFPVRAVVEIRKDGTPTRNETTEGWVQITTLEPATQCILRFWTDRFFDEHDIRVTSDDGSVVVNPWPRGHDHDLL